MGDFEATAARVLARASRAKVILQDDGSLPGMPDLRIKTSDGSVAHGEIVLDFDPDYAAMTVAARKREYRIPCPNLRRSWWLWLSKDCDVKELERKAVQALGRLESGGSLFEVITPLAEAVTHGSSAIDELASLGVTRLGSFDEPGTRQIHLQPEGTGGKSETTSEEFLDELAAVVSAHRLEDARRKLMETGSDERHLFLGVTFSSPWELWNWLSDHRTDVPDSPPQLPGEVTHIWLLQAPPLGRCLMWSPGSGWRDTRRRRTEKASK